MEHARLSGIVLPLLPLLVFVAGCAASSARAPAPRTSAPPAEPSTFDRGGFGTFHSTRFELSVGLPDGQAWRIDDHRSPWLVATHAKTASSLRARVWSEPSLASNERCLATARSWDPAIPDVAALAPVDDRTAEVHGSAMTARVVAAVAPDGSGGLDGWVLAVGASNRRCLLVVYATTASGKGAPQALGERLASMADGFAETLAFDRPFDVPRERVERPR